MSAQLPACQLLERYYGQSAKFWPVAPLLDEWLLTHSEAMVSADLLIRQRWLSRGYRATSPFEGELILPQQQVVLFWPKAHQLGVWWLKWLCHVLPSNTAIDIVGEHSGGVKRVPSVLADLGMRCDKLDNARRCTLFSTRSEAMEAPDDAWTRFEALGMTLVSHPGVFGHGKVDEGTKLLLDTLENHLPDKKLHILDMGCGDGVISTWLSKQGHQVTAIDVSAFAVEACRKTLLANHIEGRVLESDVFSALEGERFDVIVSNPPFHQERDITYGPSQQLIEGAPKHLVAKGALYVVANAFLPYPELLAHAFGSFDTLADNRRFRVYRGQLR